MSSLIHRPSDVAYSRFRDTRKRFWSTEIEESMDKLSSLERQRLSEVIRTALTADWERFKFLTDTQFSNTASIKEQFEDSSRLLIGLMSEPRPEVAVGVHKDGSRVIFARFSSDDPAEGRILLTLHSTSERPDSVISIWTFYQEMSFD